MKIVYLHQYFRTPSMSGGTRSYEMARRFVAAGHEVHIVTSSQDGAAGKKAWRQESIEGIHVHWFPVAYDNRMGFLQRLRAFLFFAWFAARKATRLRADVIFATSTPLTIAIPAIWAKRVQRVPLVFEVRDLWPELPIAVGALRNPLLKWAARRLERWAYRNSAAVVALSPGMAEGVAATGFPRNRISIVPNSCDTQMFSVSDEEGRRFRSARGWLQDRPLILYAGTFGRINGVGYLAEIARAMLEIDSEVRFLAIGGGAEEGLIGEKASDLGVLGSNFFMEPRLSKAEMPAAMNAATLCTSLFVPIKEMEANSANKFFDALAAGRPIAINYGGWQADMITRERLGCVLSGVDAEAAARDISSLVASADRLSAASLAAKRVAQGTFDRDNLAEQLLGVVTTEGRGAT